MNCMRWTGLTLACILAPSACAAEEGSARTGYECPTARTVSSVVGREVTLVTNEIRNQSWSCDYDLPEAASEFAPVSISYFFDDADVDDCANHWIDFEQGFPHETVIPGFDGALSRETPGYVVSAGFAKQVCVIADISDPVGGDQTTTEELVAEALSHIAAAQRAFRAS